MKTRYLVAVILILAVVCTALSVVLLVEDDDPLAPAPLPFDHASVEELVNQSNHDIEAARLEYTQRVASAKRRLAEDLGVHRQQFEWSNHPDRAEAIGELIEDLNHDIEALGPAPAPGGPAEVSRSASPTNSRSLAGSFWRTPKGGTISLNADGTCTTTWNSRLDRWKLRPDGLLWMGNESHDSLWCVGLDSDRLVYVEGEESFYMRTSEMPRLEAQPSPGLAGTSWKTPWGGTLTFNPDGTCTTTWKSKLRRWELRPDGLLWMGSDGPGSLWTFGTAGNTFAKVDDPDDSYTRVRE